MKGRWSNYLTVIGALISVLAVIWVIRTLLVEPTSFATLFPDIWSFLSIFALAAIYGLSLILLAANWSRIVALFGTRPVESTKLKQSFLRSQIAKYLPGNFAHYVGRHIAGIESGSSHKTLAYAAICEAALLLLAASLVALLGSLLIKPVEILGVPVSMLATLVAGGSLIGLIILIERFGQLRQTDFSIVAIALVRATIFMSLLGALFYFVLGEQVELALVMAATATSWLIGFVTPGSPGGIGTREAALLLFLESAAPAGQLALAIVAFRMVTLSGDAVAFGLSYLARP